MPHSGKGKDILASEDQHEANVLLVLATLREAQTCRRDLSLLRRKLSRTYWIVIVLSVIMFLIGIALLSAPIFAAFGSNMDKIKSLAAGGFGVADLAGVFLLRPIERIHDLMGDMSQITMVLQSFQFQVDLRLVEMDVNDPNSVGKTAQDISTAAKESIELVQNYFESKQDSKQGSKPESKPAAEPEPAPE
jgi:hypothetical protein